MQLRSSSLCVSSIATYVRSATGCWGQPGQRTCSRLLVKDIQVHDRRRIIPTYRTPAAVRAIPRKMGGTMRCANRLEIKGEPLAT